jgi:hypothetical protein
MDITLKRKNLAFIAKYAALTGYTPEEFASWCLADYLKMFENTDGSFLQETIGSMYFKDREAPNASRPSSSSGSANTATSTASKPRSTAIPMEPLT